MASAHCLVLPGIHPPHFLYPGLGNGHPNGLRFRVSPNNAARNIFVHVPLWTCEKFVIDTIPMIRTVRSANLCLRDLGTVSMFSRMQPDTLLSAARRSFYTYVPTNTWKWPHYFIHAIYCLGRYNALNSLFFFFLRTVYPHFSIRPVDTSVVLSHLSSMVQSLKQAPGANSLLLNDGLHIQLWMNKGVSSIKPASQRWWHHLSWLHSQSVPLKSDLGFFSLP